MSEIIKSKLEKAFDKFHEENPSVLELYIKYSDMVLAGGRTRFSINMITERIRWYTNVETVGGNFKMPNNHRAYYARMLDDIPRFKGLFELNMLRSKR